MVIPIIVSPLVRAAELDDRDEPVPVQHGDVSVVVRRGVPAEKVIVISADFAGRVVMADVVIVGLRQRHVKETENQNSDSHVAFAAPESTPIMPHNSTLSRRPESLDADKIDKLHRAGKVIRSN
jgi:hypothetical protein